MANPQQMAAITYLDGPLLVLAGAGSGKTRVITEKITYLIEQSGYKAATIVAVTFTNKAANEMRQRITNAIPAVNRRGLLIATFHILGLRIIKNDLQRCGLRPGFSIFDSDDSQQLLRSFLPIGKANDRAYLIQIQQQISRWKNNLLIPNDLSDYSFDSPFFTEALAIYKRYQKALIAYNAVDFDDLILMPVLLLREHTESRERWQNSIRHLLIDEYQDSNASQYYLVKLLTGLRAQFTVVGDDDQSIYAWRGAQPQNLVQLQEDYPLLKVIKLEQNYRSTGRILHAANTLIANNVHLFNKQLWSKLGSGELLRVLCCKDEQDEAELVIADLISQRLRFSKKYGDYAILYRSNHQSRVFETVLRYHGINYRISGGQSWFARTEVKDIFAYLKLLCNDVDDAAFLRIINTPKRGIGEASLDALSNYAKKRGQSLYQCADHMALTQHIADKPRAALQAFKTWLEGIKQRLPIHTALTQSAINVLREMVKESGYEPYLYEQSIVRDEPPIKAQQRMDNVWELINWIERLLVQKAIKNIEQTLVDMINKLILIDRLDKEADEGDGNSVQLMSLHASKGLEFSYVYLVGMEEDILPHRISVEVNQIEEERRLAYVGITRAKQWVCFSLAKQRRRNGELQDCEPSRFLNELPQESLEWYGKSGVSNEAQLKAVAKSHLSALKQLLS